jgi:hypothetical protein|tara:strand:+ start:342 stop:1193 length:852 start_codon:yes stop_codon:yes gene_type:complete
MNRRDVLQGLGGVVGITWSNIGAVNYFSEGNPKVRVDTQMKPNSVFSSRSFRYASGFLKHFYDLDVTFQPAATFQQTDHLTHFSMQELSIYEHAINTLDNNFVLSPTHITAIGGPPIRASQKAGGNLIEAQIEESKKLMGDTFPAMGMSYLIGQQPCQLDLGYDLLLDEPKLASIYYGAIIVHEFNHLIGMWHSDDYSGDEISDTINDKANNVMMSKLPISEKYGVEKAQRNYVREYFDMGKVFQMFKDVEYDYGSHTQALAKKNSWTPATEKPNSSKCCLDR